MSTYSVQNLDEETSFKLYILNRKLQQVYQALLTPLNLTYPQYLAMKMLYEQEEIPVNVIAARLMLETSTVTPMLQRLEKLGFILRDTSCSDHRERIIKLTPMGESLRHQLLDISKQIASILSQKDILCDKATDLNTQLNHFLTKLT